MPRRTVKNDYKYNNSFTTMQHNIEDTTYGLCPAPMEAQVALEILTSYLLGDDWYTSAPLSVEQANACIVEQILDKYSRKWKKDYEYYKKATSSN